MRGYKDDQLGFAVAPQEGTFLPTPQHQTLLVSGIRNGFRASILHSRGKWALLYPRFWSWKVVGSPV